MSNEVFDKYVKIRKELINMGSFIELVSKFDGWKTFPPDNDSKIDRAELDLNVLFPSELKKLYTETDGVTGNYSRVVMPIAEMVNTNLEFRNDDDFSELYMPFDNLLIFGEAPNGDLFAYPVKKNGQVEGFDIFGWDHETDSRTWVASSMNDFFIRIATEVLIDASN